MDNKTARRAPEEPHICDKLRCFANIKKLKMFYDLPFNKHYIIIFRIYNMYTPYMGDWMHKISIHYNRDLTAEIIELNYDFWHVFVAKMAQK